MKTLELIPILLLALAMSWGVTVLWRLINRGCQALTDLLFRRIPSRGEWQLDSEGRIVRRIRDHAEV